MRIAIDGRRGAILLFEKFYKMRRIGEGTLVANLGYRFRCRDKQKSRLHQALLDKPSVWRHKEMTLKLLLERGERAIALLGKLLNRYVAKDMRIDYLLKIIASRIYIIQNLTLQATISLRHNKIDKFSHLYILSRFIVHKIVIVQVATSVVEEATHRTRRRDSYVIKTTTAFTLMCISDIYRVIHIEMKKNTLQLLWRVIDDNLLKGAAILHHLLDIVIAHAHIKHLTL